MRLYSNANTCSVMYFRYDTSTNGICVRFVWRLPRCGRSVDGQRWPSHIRSTVCIFGAAKERPGPDSAAAVNYTLLSRGRGISRMLSGCRALQCRKPVWAPPTPRFLVELCRFTLWFNCLMTELDFLMLRYDL